MGDLSADDFDLKYTPTNRDFSLHVPRGQGRRPVSPFFSVFGKTDYLVHGNSFITVTRNGSDVTDRSITWRRLRIWSLTGESGFSVSGKPDADWRDDNESAISNWIDIPGFSGLPSPQTWTTERQMLEFAVAVDGHLDSGIWYFYVIVSRKKRQYRVQMSSAKKIDYEGWKELKKTQQPQPFPEPFPGTYPVETGWMAAKVP